MVYSNDICKKMNSKHCARSKVTSEKIHLATRILLPMDIQSLSHLQVVWLSLRSYIGLLRCFLHDFIIIILFSYYMSEKKTEFPLTMGKNTGRQKMFHFLLLNSLSLSVIISLHITL